MTTIDLTALHLDKGPHENCDGQCFQEARALIVVGRKTDERLPGVSPVLHSMGIGLNDSFPDDRRQELKRFLPRDGVDPLAGTEYDGQDEARSYLALDWLIRTYAPAFLDLRPELADVAAELRGLRRIVDLEAAQSAGPVVRDAREKSDAARDARAAAGDAARDAAWAAARDAAWAAAGDAARDAAGDAAWPPAGDAAWAAAGDAARDAAGDAAWAAAWAAARDAAWAAARDAARAAARDAARDAARAAARDAARAALQPTVDQLQTSAIDLYARMINPALDVTEAAS